MERPHVHLVLDRIEPSYGMERATLALVAALVADGCAVSASVAHGAVRELLDLNVSVADEPPSHLGYARRCLRIVRFRTPRSATVVVAVGAWAAVPWLLRPRRGRAGTIVWEHSLIEEKVKHSRSLKILSRLARFLYARADVVVAVSPPLQTSILRMNPRIRTTVIPNVVPAVSVRSSAVRSADLVCVGSLSEVKNQSVAISALCHLPRETTLHLYGDGPLREMLAATAVRSGVVDRVTFHGRTSPDIVMEAMETAGCLVHPAAGETFGMVFFEAASAGLPVVTKSNQLTRWLVPQYVPGALYEGSDRELAQAIQRILEGPPSTEEFAYAAARRAAEFDSAAVSCAWQSLFSTRSLGRH